MKNETDYLHLAMDLSNGAFAWHFFGVVGYLSSDDALDNSAPNPQLTAREYLADFHADALAEHEAHTLETSTIGN